MYKGSSWFCRQGRSREMARSVVAADLLLNSSLSQPCLPETTRKVVKRKEVLRSDYLILNPDIKGGIDGQVRDRKNC